MDNKMETAKKQTPQERHLKAIAKKAKRHGQTLRGAARRLTRNSQRALWKQHCARLPFDDMRPSLAEYIRSEQGDCNVA